MDGPGGALGVVRTSFLGGRLLLLETLASPPSQTHVKQRHHIMSKREGERHTVESKRGSLLPAWESVAKVAAQPTHTSSSSRTRAIQTQIPKTARAVGDGGQQPRPKRLVRRSGQRDAARRAVRRWEKTEERRGDRRGGGGSTHLCRQGSKRLSALRRGRFRSYPSRS